MSLFTGAAVLAGVLAGAGATTAATVYAAKKSSDAAEHGADTQAAAAQEALDFAKGQKAKQETAYAPFGALGQQAAGMLPGLARQAPTSGPPAAYTTQPRATAPMPQSAPLSQLGGPIGTGQQGLPTMMPTSQAGPMVRLMAPDGSQRSVPQAQAQMYIAKGAKVIG